MNDGLAYWKNLNKLDYNFIDFDESKWLINCTRAEAEKLLFDKPTGTFLVRKRASQHYALSIVCNDMINHCILLKTERGYGFVEPFNIYGTLETLVHHYSTNSLEEYNDKLNTILKYPVLCNFIKNLKKNY